jgi:hypothetical protein
MFDAQLVETTIKAYLAEIRSRLEKAAGIGRAADACAGVWFHEKASKSHSTWSNFLRGNNAAECGELDQRDRYRAIGLRSKDAVDLHPIIWVARLVAELELLLCPLWPVATTDHGLKLPDILIALP